MRRIILAGLIALWPALAFAQFATIAPTPPTADNGDRIATTAWVNNFINAGGLPLASGKIFIGSAGNVATAQTPSGDCTLSLSGVITCTQAAGNFNVVGILSVGGGELQTNIVAPGVPAAGKTQIYVDSTTKTLSAKNDAGTISNTVVASLAVANQFMTGISTAGVITRAQPNFTDLAGVVSCTQEPALTGPVTSSGCATTIGANQVSRANEAQGIARSVIGVTGNATANVADIQGTANQALVVNSGGTALTFGAVNLAAAAAVTGALPFANGGNADTGTAPASFTPSPTCGTATFTVNSAKFRLLQAKITYVQIDITITAIGTCTATVLFTLPNTANSSGSLAGRESATTGNGLFCGVTAASAAVGCSYSIASTNFLVSQRIVASGVYENQ